MYLRLNMYILNVRLDSLTSKVGLLTFVHLADGIKGVEEKLRPGLHFLAPVASSLT